MELTITRAGILLMCLECSRVFDPTNEVDEQELSYGHDCEVEHEHEWDTTTERTHCLGCEEVE
jgi:hypothetical protein